MQPSNGFVDLQVNGYAGVDFNSDNLTADDLHKACEEIRDSGVVGILATFITDEIDAMSKRLSRLNELREVDPLANEIIWGVHIEGPFINPEPGYVGAHPISAVRPANVEDMKKLVEASGGLTRYVTLAPEYDKQMRTTQYLADAGIRVAAGHCNPSLDQLKAAIDAGLTLFTHLGNGCPGTMNRHDNIIQRALSLTDRLTVCWIADDIHIPYTALGNYLRCVGFERCLVVSDAISAAGLGPGRYDLAGHEIEVDENLVTCMDGDKSHLAGSATSLPQMATKLSEKLGLTDEQINKLCCDNPRRAIGM